MYEPLEQMIAQHCAWMHQNRHRLLTERDPERAKLLRCAPGWFARNESDLAQRLQNERDQRLGFRV